MARPPGSRNRVTLVTPVGGAATLEPPRLTLSPPQDSKGCGYVTPLNAQDLLTPQPGQLADALQAVLAASNSNNSIGPERKVSVRDRICCHRWTWFSMTMATGGIANGLYSIPFRSDWLDTIGLMFFLFNICLFILNCVLTALRFYWQPGTFLPSFTDQMEALFVPSFPVSVAIILLTLCQYGITEHTRVWLLRTMEVLFWIYVGFCLLASSGMYLTLWSTVVFPIHTMTPVWVFPAYPLLVTAPFGASLISAAVKHGSISSINAVVIALACVAVQGAGFSIAFMVCAAFLYRLMTQKLPRDAQRPGVFISVGPSGFTVVGLVRLGNLASSIFPDDFADTKNAVAILRLLSYMLGLWLWGLTVWFFLVSVGSLWKYLFREHRNKMPFQMLWFSFVFPNTALVAATNELGKSLGSWPMQVVGCILAACLVVVWALVFACMLRSLWRRKLLWPEDVTDKSRE